MLKKKFILILIILLIVFAGTNPTKGKLEDVDNDGDLDLMLHFKTQGLQLSPDDIEATLTGQLTNGTLIKGTDSIRIAPSEEKENKEGKKSPPLIGMIPLCIIGIGLFIQKKKNKIF